MARTYPVVAICVLLEELEVLLGADHRSRVAGESDDGQCSEDGIDGLPFETEFA